jgi:hypothetical protein
MLNKFPDAQYFAREPELLLCGFKGRDRGRGVVGAVQVPGEEAGEVLERAEDFVATDWEGELVRGREGDGRRGVGMEVPVVATNFK